MFVDSHCHLAFPEFAGQGDAIVRRMTAAGVDRALCICTTMAEFDAVHALALAHPQLWCTVGVHPDSDDAAAAEPGVDDLLRCAALPRVVAIGETGLDYYRLAGRSIAEMAWQRDRFAVHIRAARASGLPLVVHTRSASDDTIALLRGEGQGGPGADARGVFHCFTETMDVARAALDLGFYVSFSGIVTFRNADALRDVARFVPLDRCLIETDSPYLAPVPHRGKTNEPAFVPHVAAKLAEVKGIGVADVAAATSANFERLFDRTTAAPATRAATVSLTPQTLP